jgi:hypothetical protein
MEFKHTPGPWVVSDSPLGYTESAIKHGTGMMYLNVVAGRAKIVTKCLHKDSMTLIANAKLIAAAPELLDALIAAYNELNLKYNDTEVINKAKGAIKKATE